MALKSILYVSGENALYEICTTGFKATLAGDCQRVEYFIHRACKCFL